MTQCLICLSFLDKNLVVGPCGHPFHKDCIFGWIRIKETCPHCLQKMNVRMLCRLRMQPMMIFKEIVKDPKKFNELPEVLRKQINDNKSNSLGDGSGRTLGEVDEKSNATILELRELVAEQNKQLSSSLKRLSKLEMFQKEAIETRIMLEDRVASLDLAKLELDKTVAKLKRRRTSLTKENDDLKHATRVQRNLERLMNGQDFSLSEIVELQDPLEQTSLLLPMVNQLREQNRKIRMNYIDMERKAELWTAAQLVRTQELRADLKEVQRRLIKSDAKRDRYKQKLEAMSKLVQPARKQRVQLGSHPGGGTGVTITPGIIEPGSTKRKQPLSSFIFPVNSYNLSRAVKSKSIKRKFGFGSENKSTSKGGSLVMKRRRLGNSIF